MFLSSGKNIFIILLALIIINPGISQKKSWAVAASTGSIIIHFDNKVNGRLIVLTDSTYVNPFGEPFTISKFRYYISNIKFHSESGSARESNSYHLIDAGKPASQVFSCRIKEGNYSSITFLLGVDSLHNVSGAQSGALDPLNDMFWTWNTGYVMAKFEGSSPVSSLRNNIFEYHIGGFKGINKVLRLITLKFPNERLKVSRGHSSELFLQADANEWWHGSIELKISANPSISSPGNVAKLISENYAKMFAIQKIVN